MFKYKVVSLLDVEELLTFVKRDVRGLDEEIKEDKRVEKELRSFITEVEKHSGHKIHFIGHEKRYGKHMVRFIFSKGGFLEVIVEKPLTFNAHFIEEKTAERFAHGLKSALHKSLPEHPVKNVFIDSIKVEDGFKDEVISMDKWSLMHKIVIHKTLVTSLIVLMLFIILETTQEFIEHETNTIFGLNTAIISIGAAVIIAFFFEPIKEKIEELLGKILKI